MERLRLRHARRRSRRAARPSGSARPHPRVALGRLRRDRALPDASRRRARREDRDRLRHDAMSDETRGQPRRDRHRAWCKADLATRTADRPKWFAENAAGFFGADLPGVRVSPEFTEFMIRQCLDCSARATVAVLSDRLHQRSPRSAESDRRSSVDRSRRPRYPGAARALRAQDCAAAATEHVAGVRERRARALRDARRPIERRPARVR